MLPRWADYGRWQGRDFKVSPYSCDPLLWFYQSCCRGQFWSRGIFQGKIPQIACILLWCFYPFLLGGSSLSIYDYKSQHCEFEALKHLVDSLLTMKEDSTFSSFQYTHCDWDLEPSHHFRLLGYAGTRHLYHHGFVLIREVFIIIVNQRIGDICRCWYC